MKRNFARVIDTINLLLQLRGSNSTSPFVVDKHARKINFIFLLWQGEKIYLLILLLLRYRDIRIIRGGEKKNFRPLPDRIALTKKWNIKNILIRFSYIFFSIKILHSPFLNPRKTIIDKYLVINFLWYFISIQNLNLKKLKKIVLNFDFSPIDAAIFASCNTSTSTTVLIPAFAKENDSYYSTLASVADEFLMQRNADYLPKKIRLQKCRNKIRYSVGHLRVNKKFPITVFLILSTFKNNQKKRIPIVIKALNNLIKKYGHNAIFFLRPHPYEYELFAHLKEIQELGVKVSLESHDLDAADLCIVAGTSLIFDLALKGIPFVFVTEIDSYYPNCYKIFKNPLLLSVKSISDLPDYKRIITLNKNKDRWKKITKKIVGNIS